MAIDVRWFPTLVKRTHSGKAQTSVDWKSDLTPLAVFEAEGFTEKDSGGLLILVNGARSPLDKELEDGDRVEFLINLQGG